MTIKRNIETEFTLTPEELAGEFWGLDGDQQARFFNAVGKLAQHRLPMQMQYVQDSDFLDQDGRYAMSVIGNYSEAQNG
ncbi:hypothetical protein CASP1_00008 [Alcaligenes phage CASP1]|nr:hypothetical protein CASP1_00008 [Alcaligenes phage CASP1]